MLTRVYKAQESLTRYWAEQAIELCYTIDDEPLLSYIEPVREALRTMGRARRVTAIGAKGSGKSSLLAGIVDYAPIAVVPLRGGYTIWRTVCSEGEESSALYIPSEEMEGIEIVDTADASDPCLAPEIEKLAAQSDVVIAVMDAGQAENFPCWEMMQRLPEDSGSIIVAVTHSDKMAADALLQLQSKLREECRKQFQTPPPLFFVNPASPQAMESFTNRIQEALASPNGIRKDIRQALKISVEFMYKQGSVLSTRDSVSRMDSGFLASIETEIDHFLSHQMEGLSQRVNALTNSSYKALPKLLRRFFWGFGNHFSPVTLLRLELFGNGSEAFYYDAISRELLHMQETSDQQFVISCAAHWKSVRPRMKKALECEIGDFPTETMETELAKLRERLSRDLYEPFKQGRMRMHLSNIFNERAGWMFVTHVALCLLLSIGGVLGFAGQNSLAIYCVEGAFGLWLLATSCHIVASKRIRREIVTATESIRPSLERALAEAIKQLIVSRVSAYRSLYAAPREKVARHIDMLEPLQKRHSKILGELRSAAPRV